MKRTPWEKAKKIAEKECPYREHANIPDEEDMEATWDEDEAHNDWIPGFAHGVLGVPDNYIRHQDYRYFWQGYEAGVAKANGGAK